MQDDAHLVGIGDDVVIGDHIAARIDDEAGAERRNLTRRPVAAAAAATLLPVKEILEEFLKRRAGRELRHAFRQGAGARAVLHCLGGGDIHHRRQQLLGQIGKVAFRCPRLGRCQTAQHKLGSQYSGHSQAPE